MGLQLLPKIQKKQRNLPEEENDKIILSDFVFLYNMRANCKIDTFST
jgi:hypothetical protein